MSVKGRSCIRLHSELSGVVREEKLWGVLVVTGRHLGMTRIAFGVAVEEWLG